MKNIYFFLPFVVWFIVQIMKTFIDYFFNDKKNIFSGILNSYGRFPSGHSAFMSSLITLIYLIEGYSLLLLSVFMISLLFWFDAVNVRLQVGEQGKLLNNKFKLKSKNKFNENVGHKYYEVIGGIILGSIITLLFYNFV